MSKELKMHSDKSDYNTLILLKIVHKMILQTKVYGEYKLKKIIDDKEGPKIKEIQPKIISKEQKSEQIKIAVKNKLSSPQIKKEELTKNSIIQRKEEFVPSKKIVESQNLLLPKMMQKKPNNFPLNMPERNIIVPRDNLPAHLTHIQPEKNNKSIDFDLGELNVLMYDPNVRMIECVGENENIYVTGKMGRRPTIIKLTSEEIQEIIDKFSKKSKIPISEGLFKVHIGNLQFIAIISKSISSRFIIKKL